MERGASYLNERGKEWQIGAHGLALDETPPRNRPFEDLEALFSETGRRIRAKTKAGYVLKSNRVAEKLGLRNEVSDAQLELVKAQFGPRRSIWTDPYQELAEVLSDPESYEGGVLLIPHDLVLDNHWDIGKYAAVVVLGNCTVAGLVYQYETEPWLIVTGDLRARNLVLAGNMDVGGDVIVDECAEFESGLGYAHIGGTLQASTVLAWDMPVTCERLACGALVSTHSTEKAPRGTLVCNEHEIGKVIGRPLYGPKLLHFDDCVLDFNGLVGAERDASIAAGTGPELDFNNRRLIHLLGLRIQR